VGSSPIEIFYSPIENSDLNGGIAPSLAYFSENNLSRVEILSFFGPRSSNSKFFVLDRYGWLGAASFEPSLLDKKVLSFAIPISEEGGAGAHFHPLHIGDLQREVGAFLAERGGVIPPNILFVGDRCTSLSQLRCLSAGFRDRVHSARKRGLSSIELSGTAVLPSNPVVDCGMFLDSKEGVEVVLVNSQIGLRAGVLSAIALHERG